MVRQTSTRDTDLWPEVHRSSHCARAVWQRGHLNRMPGTSRSGAGAAERALQRELFLAWWPSSPSLLSPSLSGASQHGVHVVAQVDKQERRWLEEHVLSHLVLVSVFTAAYSQTEAT